MANDNFVKMLIEMQKQGIQVYLTDAGCEALLVLLKEDLKMASKIAN